MLNSREPFKQTADPFLTLASPSFSGEKDITAGFTIRSGGFSPSPFHSNNMAFHVGDTTENVIKNREKLAAAAGRPLSTWTAAEQVHKADIIRVEKQDAGKGAWTREGRIAEADGMYTQSPDVTLVSFYADCVPLYFHAPRKGLIGLAHAGWKGTALNIGARMIEIWEKTELVEPEDIYVVIGPCISAQHYEVDKAVINAVEQKLEPSALKPWTKNSDGGYQLDMKALNHQLVEQAGVPGEQIEVTSYCSYEDEQLFFSHRRDQGKSGRMMSFIGKNED